MVLVFGVSPVVSADEWETVLEPAFRSFLNAIYFVTEDEGWVVGQSGQILHTTNGGLTWEDKGSVDHQDHTFESVFFLDNTRGWVTSNAGLVLKTTDGGESWAVADVTGLIPHIVINRAPKIQFISADVGFVLFGRANNHFIMRSDDGGETWAVQDSLIGANWLDFDFFDENRGVLVSNNADGQYYTSNGGADWLASESLAAVSSLTSLNSVRWVDESTVIAIGQGNSFQSLGTPVYISTDGGATWEQQSFDPIPTYEVFLGLDVQDAENAVAVGHDRSTRAVVAKTTDGGANWSVTPLQINSQMQGLTAVGNVLYAYGSSSHIIKSTDYGDTWEVLPINPYSEIRTIVAAGETGFAVNANSGFFALGENDTWSFVSSALQNSPGRGNNMFFLDENTGFIQKDNRQIVKTVDGGQTWTLVLENIPHVFNNRSGGIYFTDENTGYAWMSVATGTGYQIYKTTNGGDDWTELQSLVGPANVIGVLKFFDDSNGFIAGPRRWVLRTDDAFDTYEEYTVSEGFPEDFATNADFRDAVVIDGNTAWAVGNKFMVKTVDGGETWTWVNHGVADMDSNFYSIAMNGDFGYAVTFDGYIIKTSDAGETWEKDETFVGEKRFITAGFVGDRVFIGSTDGYIYAGDVPEVLITIGEARTKAIGERIVVEGIITSPDFGFSNAEFYLQDETAGIKVRWVGFGGGNTDTPFRAGDAIRLSGELSSRYDELLIAPNDYEPLSEDNPLPAPVDITTDDWSVESEYQGMRIRLMNMVLPEDAPWPTEPIGSGSGMTTYITNEAGTDTFHVRIDRDESYFEGTPRPEHPFNLSGNLGHFYEEVQLFPFFEDDIHFLVSVDESVKDIPTQFYVNQNYPNPFNPATVIEYGLSGESEVRVVIYNILGQHVRTLVNEYQNAGRYQVTFDAGNLSSGLYIYVVKTDTQTIQKRMLLLK
jgi:photosystem II stability/assembly factor-like uncharacterized protein